MYELNNKVRLINVTDYPITNCDEFLGFICGIISQDNDLEEMFLLTEFVYDFYNSQRVIYQLDK